MVPAFNEAQTIGAAIAGLLPHVSRVIVVDDRSTDGTGDIAQRAGAEVVRHSENQGYDASLNDGFKAAASSGADIIFTFDADGEHDAADVPRILAPLLTDEADIALGQRPRTRHLGEDIFAAYTRSRFGIRDPLCGLKAYRRSVYNAVGFFDSLSSIGTELTIRGIRKGFRVVLVPVALRPRLDTSRFYASRFRGTMRMLRALARIMSL